MKRLLFVFAFLILIGAGCSDAVPSQDQHTTLPSEFYALMNWQHSPEGGIGTVADVRAEAKIVMRFEEFEFDQEVDFGAQYSVEGTVEYYPDFFACRSANAAFSCEVTGWSDGAVSGVAYVDGDVLKLKMNFAGVTGALELPTEFAVVTTDLGVLPETELFQLQSTLIASEFIGGEIEVPINDGWFSDEYFIALEAGEVARLEDDSSIEIISTFIEGVDTYIGTGSGLLVLYQNHPFEQ